MGSAPKRKKVPKSFNGPIAEEARVSTLSSGGRRLSAWERGTSRQIKGEAERDIRVEKPDNAIEDHYIHLYIYIYIYR